MAKTRYRQIEKTEAIENAGSYGTWRRELCRKYRELLIQTRNNSYNALLKTLASKGEAVSCRKGCTHCCFHYVAVPLTHGMAIADYLYDKKEALKKFIHNYEKWCHKGYDISNVIDQTRAHAFASAVPINDIIALTRPLSMRYLEMGIACPFLEKDTCLIYPVRPLPCSGQFSVTPEDWCNHKAEENPVIYQLVPDDEDLLKILQLADPKMMVYEITLPIMIYRLLTQGSSFATADSGYRLPE